MASLNNRRNNLNTLGPGDINHSDLLASDLRALLNAQRINDVCFVLDTGERIPAHRIILAARSEYFRALLFGGMKESVEQDVVIGHASSRAFRKMIEFGRHVHILPGAPFFSYAYTGGLMLEGTTCFEVVELLGLSHQFQFTVLEDSLGEHLKKIMNANSFAATLVAANLYNRKDLVEFCLDYADNHAHHVLPLFDTYPKSVLMQIIKRDSFYAPECEIYEGVVKWFEKNPTKVDDVKEMLAEIRMPLISTKDLLGMVRRSGLVNADTVLDAIESQVNLNFACQIYRGIKELDRNVATSANISGAELGILANYQMFNMLRPGVTCHFINNDETDGVKIDLKKPYIINKVAFNIFNVNDGQGAPVNASYIVRVSAAPDKYWLEVANYKDYCCNGRQSVVFAPLTVRYIRIIGVEAPLKAFAVSQVEAMFSSTETQVEIRAGLIVPKKNVALASKDAQITNGVSRTRHALISGIATGYDWENNYTCHQIGNGSIVVQLNQPYCLESMRLLLWDGDARYYSYYVEISTNNVDWTTICDRRHFRCRSWQLILFDATPVVFIRLTGTFNSTNEVFHVVHLETPADMTQPMPGPESAVPYEAADFVRVMPRHQEFEEQDDDDDVAHVDANMDLEAAVQQAFIQQNLINAIMVDHAQANGFVMPMNLGPQ